MSIACKRVTADSPAESPATESRFDIVHSDAIKFFPNLVEHLGGSPTALLEMAKIDPAIFTKRGSVLEYSALVDLLDIAATELGCQDFGLRLAAFQGGTRVMGPIGVVMKNSKTLGQALGYCAKQIHAYSLATRVRWFPDSSNHKLFIGLEILLDRVRSKSQALEHGLQLANFNIIDITGGAARARRVSFRHMPLLPLHVYRSAFGCEVLFNQPADGLTITEQDLLCAVVDPDEQIYEMATSFIADRFPAATPPMHARVRSLIARYLCEDCTSERIANELCMHPRTLQRRLKTEGKSFESIKDEVRREVALRYIQYPDVSLSQLAQKLGYAEESVFSRSCYRWFSASPRVLRGRLAEGFLTTAEP